MESCPAGRSGLPPILPRALKEHPGEAFHMPEMILDLICGKPFLLLYSERREEELQCVKVPDPLVSALDEDAELLTA